MILQTVKRAIINYSTPFLIFTGVGYGVTDKVIDKRIENKLQEITKEIKKVDYKPCDTVKVPVPYYIHDTVVVPVPERSNIHYKDAYIQIRTKGDSLMYSFYKTDTTQSGGKYVKHRIVTRK